MGSLPYIRDRGRAQSGPALQHAGPVKEGQLIALQPIHAVALFALIEGKSFLRLAVIIQLRQPHDFLGRAAAFGLRIEEGEIAPPDPQEKGQEDGGLCRLAASRANSFSNRFSSASGMRTWKLK